MFEQTRRQDSHTHDVDPTVHSYRVSRNRLHSLACAIAGCGYMLRRQKNTRIMAGATLAVVLTGIWIGLEAVSWAVLILAIAFVWIAEFVNAAIEAAVNLYAPEFHLMAKVAKDVAAGAVLIAAVAAAVIGLLVLGPPIVDKLSLSVALI